MKYAVLYGGTDGEREISFKSGGFVAKTLWEMGLDFDQYILPDQIDAFFSKHKEYDLAFPMFHGAYWEDGLVFGLLEALGVPHTHSSTGVHAQCFDKHKTNTLVSNLGVNISNNFLIPRGAAFDETRIHKELAGKTLFVKPNTWGSSIGAYKVDDPLTLNEYITKSQQAAPGKTLVEEYIPWAEYSVGILWSGSDLTVVPIMKVELEDAAFFDFDVKYNDQWGKETFPDDIEPSLQDKLISDSKLIYSYLGCTTVARIDYIVSAWVPYFLEINTVPGFTEVSIVPRAWRRMGRTNEQLIQLMIDLSKN